MRRLCETLRVGSKYVFLLSAVDGRMVSRILDLSSEFTPAKDRAPKQKIHNVQLQRSAQSRSIRGHEHSDSRRHALAERVEPLGKGSEGQDFGESL